MARKRKRSRRRKATSGQKAASGCLSLILWVVLAPLWIPLAPFALIYWVLFRMKVPTLRNTGRKTRDYNPGAYQRWGSGGSQSKRRKVKSFV